MSVTEDFSPGFTEFLMRAGRLPLLSAVQEVELAQRREAGDVEAGRLLVEHNIRLAVSVAKRYRGKGVPLEDLVQEGVIGLHRAVSKWEWDRGLRFSTYAGWWIQHFVQRSVQNMGSTIRTPNHVSVARGKLFGALRENPDLTDEELCLIVGCKPSDLVALRDVSRVVASLDRRLDGFEEISPAEVKRHMTVDEDWRDATEDVRITSAMRGLGPLERSVLELRFGFHGSVLNRDEVAEKLGIAASAVVKAQRSGLLHLRKELGAGSTALPARL